MNKNLISLLLVILFLSSISTSVSGDTFTGVGNKTTATFESVKYTKIDWTTTASNEFDIFSAFIEPIIEDVFFLDSFDGSTGTTYLYEEGTFYFDVIAANLDSWEITTTPTTGEYFTDTTSGQGNSNTKLFECFGECEITWSTVAANEFDVFSAFIEPIEEKLFFFEFFDGASGSTFLYESGLFYFNVIAANLESWTINLDITPATNDATLSDTSILDDESSSLTTDNDKQSESSTDEEAVGFTGLLVLVAIVTKSIIRYNMKKKK
ncbi:MAG: hypothetical protein HeimC2_11260 [Candidatus Heimdallarchaeota archaeon LC_2]|nr:MAG: hypothetical protein HeimC2_11260 [Candidatus Heimdallarchaeota archaeon LC_2]